jgi:hypothetical protein
MLRKMSLCAMAALTISSAFAQTTMQGDWQNVSNERHWSGANWNPTMAQTMNMRYQGDEGMVWSHAMMSLNATEQFDLMTMFRRLDGSSEHILKKAIASSAEKHAGDYLARWQKGEFANMTAGSNMNPANTSGTANQPMVGGTSMYPREWEMRSVGDLEAYDMLVGGLDESERGVFRRVWPTLEWREQRAIMKIIKQSPNVHSSIMRYESWNTPRTYGTSR